MARVPCACNAGWGVGWVRYIGGMVRGQAHLLDLVGGGLLEILGAVNSIPF